MPRIADIGALVGLVTLALLCAPVEAATHRVPSGFPTIQAGIDAAAFGDTVLVEPGIYDEGEVRTFDTPSGPVQTAAIAFLKDGVTLRSEQGPAATTLDLVSPSAPLEVVVIGALLNSGTSVLEGFRIQSTGTAEHGLAIQRSTAYTVRQCVFEGITSDESGAAINSRDVTLEVEDCEFRDCTSPTGAGIRSFPLSLIVTRCLFENCGARAIWATGESLPGHDVIIHDSEFRSNYSTHDGGAIAVSDMSGLIIERCAFEDNLAMTLHGGAIVANETDVVIRDNLFVRNWAGHVGSGGAFALFLAAGTISGNTFYGNGQEIAAAGGAAIQVSGVQLEFLGNIVSETIGGSAIRLSQGGYVNTSCNVFWENKGGHVEGFELDPTDRIVDPLFCDAEAGDLTLHEDSPCLPENSGGCGLIGALGAGCGTATNATKSLVADSWARIKARYATNR
jgi:predicted outer membrane repeat protein